VTHHTPDLFAFLDGWLPPPPARVLEVGCGDGTLTRRLLDAGYDAHGIDPRAPGGPSFDRTTLEAFHADAPFDAAVAILSLHHMHDLAAALTSLERALRPGARLVMFEFAMERVDDRARRWLVRHGLDAHPGDPPDVIPMAGLMAALRERFRLVEERRGGFLAREHGREDLHEAEEAAIAAGELQAIGAWLVYERPG
jgi:ubiquinone/menaquinone biosynthesis C-methylase UbiE